MSDNNEEEALYDPAPAQLDNPPGMPASLEEKATPKTNQVSENMEVHHHPDLHHQPKKWKEYFLEFLMIFLAVTMGFFAENIREHISENRKETEYIKGLVEDFETDTTLMNGAIIYNDSKLYKDTLLLRILYGSKTDSGNLRKIYALYAQTTNFDPEFYDSRTFDLLKNTGDLKLIRNDKVLKRVSDYYRRTASEKTFSNEIQEALVTTYNFSHKCFDGYAAEKLPGNKLSLITNNEEIVKEYANSLYQLSIDFIEYKRHLLALRSETIALIELTKKEYRL